MSIRFLYFDLGKVLVDFCIERMFRQIGAAAEIPADLAKSAIIDGGLLHGLESGRLSEGQFYEAFCGATGSRPSVDAMSKAASDIFDLKTSMTPLVAQLREAGWPLGILSNTCDWHWNYCRSRFCVLSECFDVHVLSYRVGAVKPEADIFHKAAEMAGVRPEEIFFVDDIAAHVEGARAMGIDAVQYRTTAELAEQLRRRGLRFNY